MITTDQEKLKEWFESFWKMKSNSETKFIGRVREGRIIAVAAYSAFTPFCCNAHIASIETHWLNREFLRVMFDYPFNQLNLKCIMAHVHADNHKSIGLLKHLGFSVVAEIPNAHYLGDLVLFALQRENCNYLLKEAA